jgi:uncharacterized protein
MSTAVRVANVTKNSVLGDRVVVAETNLARMIGLLGKAGLEPGEGLIIYPSQSIHTVAMRFAIDVIFADRNWRVTHLHPRMVPYRLTGLHWRARCAIELPAGTIAESSTCVGDELSVTEVE